jgi:hypothetical protein
MRLGKGWDQQKLGRRKHDHEFYLVGAFLVLAFGRIRAFKGLKRKEDCGRIGKVP